MRLRFWLLCMDVLSWLNLDFSRAYLYALRKASDATDWGPELEPSDGEGPF